MCVRTGAQFALARAHMRQVKVLIEQLRNRRKEIELEGEQTELQKHMCALVLSFLLSSNVVKGPLAAHKQE